MVHVSMHFLYVFLLFDLSISYPFINHPLLPCLMKKCLKMRRGTTFCGAVSTYGFKPYRPTSASPSHPSMHCLDMHRLYLQDTLETHVGQSSHLASLIMEQKSVRNISSYKQSTVSFTFENKERCYHFARCSNSQSTCSMFCIRH